jgi:hypothetical protein
LTRPSWLLGPYLSLECLVLRTIFVCGNLDQIFGKHYRMFPTVPHVTNIINLPQKLELSLFLFFMDFRREMYLIFFNFFVFAMDMEAVDAAPYCAKQLC